MKVYLVLEICDDEYFFREVVFVGSTYDKAWEWIEAHGGQQTVVGWDDVPRPYYIVEDWRMDV